MQVDCPRFMSANDLLACRWHGFHDPESGIDHFQLFVGTAEGDQDIYESSNIEAGRTSMGVPGILINAIIILVYDKII